MKTIISDNDGFLHIVELTKIASPAEYVHLRFSTEWDYARRDGSAQTQLELFLNPQQLANLKDML
jgi:hypothetical protein